MNTIRMPLLSIIVTGEELNRLAHDRGLPILVDLAKDDLILEVTSLPGILPGSVRVSISRIAPSWPVTRLSISNITYMHHLPVPDALVKAVLERYPWIRYEEGEAAVDLTRLLPRDFRFGSGEVTWNGSCATVTLEDLVLPLPPSISGSG